MHRQIVNVRDFSLRLEHDCRISIACVKEAEFILPESTTCRNCAEIYFKALAQLNNWPESRLIRAVARSHHPHCPLLSIACSASSKNPSFILRCSLQNWWIPNKHGVRILSLHIDHVCHPFSTNPWGFDSAIVRELRAEPSGWHSSKHPMQQWWPHCHRSQYHLHQKGMKQIGDKIACVIHTLHIRYNII